MPHGFFNTSFQCGAREATPYLSGGSVGPWAWLLELSPEVAAFWEPACCPSCPLWLPMLPKGGNELGLPDGTVLPGWPEEAVWLLDDAEPFPEPLLLLDTEELCWLAVLEEELDCCDI